MEQFTINLPEGMVKADILAAIATFNNYKSTITTSAEVEVPNAEVTDTDVLIIDKGTTSIVLRYTEEANPVSMEEFALAKFQKRLIGLFTEVQTTLQERAIEEQVRALRASFAATAIEGGSVE